MKLASRMLGGWVLTCLLMTQPTNILPASQPTSAGTEQQKSEELSPPLKFIGKHTPKVLAFELFILFASDQAKKSMLEQFQPKNLGVNCAQQILMHILATIIHEAGHATVAQFLTGKPAIINLGSSEKKEPLFSLGSINITGLNPAAGYTEYSSPQNQLKGQAVEFMLDWCKRNGKNHSDLTKEEQAKILEEFTTTHASMTKSTFNPTLAAVLILLAGGTAAILGNYLIKILFALGKKAIHPSTTNLATALKQSFKPDTILFEQLSTMLMPYQNQTGGQSDGKRIWDICDVIPEEIVQKIGKLTPYLDCLAQGYLANKGRTTSDETTARDALLVGLINYYWRGYLAFHV